MPLRPLPLVSILAIALSSGCSCFRSSTQEVYIDCNIPGVEAEIGEMRRPIPARLNIERNKPLLIVVNKPGYHEYRQNIESRLNTTGIIDVVGAWLWLVPLIGIFAPGSKSLDQTDVYVNLVADPAGEQASAPPPPPATQSPPPPPATVDATPPPPPTQQDLQAISGPSIWVYRDRGVDRIPASAAAALPATTPAMREDKSGVSVRPRPSADQGVELACRAVAIDAGVRAARSCFRPRRWSRRAGVTKVR